MLFAGIQANSSLAPSSSTISLTGPKFPPGTMRITDQIIEEVDEQLTIQSNRGQEKRPTAQSIFASYDEKQPIRSAPINVPATHHKTDVDYDRSHSVITGEHHPYIFPNNTIFSTSAPEENVDFLQTPTINIDKPDEPKDSATKSSNKGMHYSPRDILDFSFQICIFFFSGSDVEDVDYSGTRSSQEQIDDSFEQLRLAREKERIERQKQKIARSVSQQTGGNLLDTESLLDQLTNSKSDGLNRVSYIDPNA